MRKILPAILLCASTLGLSCTAYLNTYYNGESAFYEGNKEHKKVMRNYPDSLVTTPSQTVSTKYDRAIEKSQKVLDVYSKKKKWHDDALFLMGKTYFYKKDFSKAIRRFKELQMDFPQSPHIPESYLYLAKSFIEEDNLDKAEDQIEIIFQKYPHLDKDHQVSLLLVDIAIRRESKAQAISYMEKALGKVKSEADRIDLILRMSELYIQLKQYEKAMVLLEKTPRKKDLPEQSYRMDKALLNCYMEVDSLSRALSFADLMLKKRLYSQYFDEVLLTKGIILSRMGRFDEAIAVLRKITADIDSSTVSSDTSLVVSKALYQLGLIYQKKKGDYVNAEKFFKLSSQSKDKNSVSLSSRRLSAIEMLKDLRSRKSESREVHNATYFKIGELFRYELDEPDSAYNQFLSLYMDSTAGPEVAPKALCAAAFVARDGMKDSTLSDSLFKEIISKFSSTDFARIAQEELQLPLTVKTRRDSAMAAFKEAEDMVYGSDNDVKGAVQAFYNIYKTYGDQQIAPKALYAAAYLSDEYLQKNVTAKQLYERICQKYPESIYCTAAQPRIKVADSTLVALGAKKVSDSKQEQSAPTGKKKNKKDSAKKESHSADSTDSLRTVSEENSQSISEGEFNESSDLERMESEKDSLFGNGTDLPSEKPVSVPESQDSLNTIKQ